MFSPGKFIDTSWNLYRKNIGVLWRISLWFGIVSVLTLILLFLTPSYNELPFVNADQTFTPISIIASVASLIVTFIVTPIVSIWIGIALIRAIHALANKKKVDVSETMSSSWKWFSGSLAIAVLVSLIQFASILIPIAPGTILIAMSGYGPANPIIGFIGIALFIIGIIVGLVYLIKYTVELTFAQFEYVLVGKSVMDALRGSRKKVTCVFWKVFFTFIGISFFVSLLYIVVSTVAFFIGSTIINLFTFSPVMTETVGGTLDILVTLLLFTIFTPLAIVPIYVLYTMLPNNKKPAPATKK